MTPASTAEPASCDTGGSDPSARARASRGPSASSPPSAPARRTDGSCCARARTRRARASRATGRGRPSRSGSPRGRRSSGLKWSGTMRPLTLAPTVRCPTSVWTAYAKSIGVAPAGSVLTSPFGVKTNTSSSKRSVRNDLANSRASDLVGVDVHQLPHPGRATPGRPRPSRCACTPSARRRRARPSRASRAYAPGSRAAVPGTDHGRVQRAVPVELRHRDVVLEAARHRLPERVDQAERAVAVAWRLLSVALDDHAHRGQVVDLVEPAPFFATLSEIERSASRGPRSRPGRRPCRARARARRSASATCPSRSVRRSATIVLISSYLRGCSVWNARSSSPT